MSTTYVSAAFEICCVIASTWSGTESALSMLSSRVSAGHWMGGTTHRPCAWPTVGSRSDAASGSLVYQTVSTLSKQFCRFCSMKWWDVSTWRPCQQLTDVMLFNWTKQTCDHWYALAQRLAYKFFRQFGNYTATFISEMLACDSLWIYCHSHSVPRPWPVLPLPPTPLQHRRPAASPLSRMMSYWATQHKNWPRDDVQPFTYNHGHTLTVCSSN